jgi:uncharacterized membrane protein
MKRERSGFELFPSNSEPKILTLKRTVVAALWRSVPFMKGVEMAITETFHHLSGRSQARSANVNVSPPERWVSALGGGALLAYGATHRSWNRALLMMTIGGGLLHRAVTGHCQLYKALNVSTALNGGNGVTSVHHRAGIKVEHAVAIRRSAEDLYRFWRNIENLPTFMSHLQSVRMLNDGRSHWVVRAPAGKTVEWDAGIHNDIENELIAWRSLKGADINHAGSVRFHGLADGVTEVKLAMSFEPPFGRFGLEIARLLGEDPAQQVREDLLRFKDLMEKGGPSDEIKQRGI